MSRSFISLILWLLVAAVAPASAQDNDWRVDGAGRVVALSDIHGAYDAMVATLQNVGILDDSAAWSGGTSRLVIVGDVLDRGPRSRDVMDLLMRLEGEAQSAGGHVHVLIGNHESMDMIGDLRYVSKEEYAAFAPDETLGQRNRWFRAYVRRQPVPRDEEAIRERFDSRFPPGFFALRKALGPEGKYGKWLLQKPIIAVINGTAFVHGGLSPLVTEYGLDGVNGTLKSQLVAYVRALYTLMEAEILLPTDSEYEYAEIVAKYMPPPQASPEVLAALKTMKSLDSASVLASDGPLWYRGNVACGGVIEEERLADALDALGAKRVVVGHTPTPGHRTLQRFDGRLIEVDTGMLNFYYHGSGNALVLNGDDTRVFNQAGGDPYEPLPQPRSVGMRPHDMPAAELEALLRTGEVVGETKDPETGRTIIEISDNDHVVSALFSRRKGRGFFPDVAAYRLDRLLDLEMVPVTVLREVDGKEGSVQFFPPKTIDEEGRAANNRGYSAMCPLGDQLMAMYVFDVLIFNEGRTRQRMLYDMRDWGLVLIEHDNAFATKKGRPRHLTNVPLDFSDGWKNALESLSDGVLDETLSDVLPAKRLRALEQRRDEILRQTSGH